jgi:septum formation protein
MKASGNFDPEAGAASGQFDLVLASTSPYRRALLERLGIPFRTQSPACDERALTATAEESNPIRLAERLAHAKAMIVSTGESDAATIIGCDQLLSFEGRILGKPGTIERAIEQLQSLAGQQHELITAMVVIRGSRTFRHTDVSRLWMRELSRAAIERYVLAERPLDCCGSYKIESRGIALFERIESSDHTSITGLPLVALVSILTELGFDFP